MYSLITFLSQPYLNKLDDYNYSQNVCYLHISYMGLYSSWLRRGQLGPEYYQERNNIDKKLKRS